MRRIPSIAQLAVVLGLLLVTLAPMGGTTRAQSVPNTDAYVEPKCFATVVAQAYQPIAEVSGSREPGMGMYSTGDEIFLSGAGMQLGGTRVKIEAAQQRMAELDTQMRDLRREARRQNIPPGWLRGT